MYNLECPTTDKEYQKFNIINEYCNSIIEMFQQNYMSIRICADNLMIGKSTVHRYIHTYIRVYYYEDYLRILTRLEYNKKYRCMPRKYW